MIRTAECVSPMHPDKMCDRISDTLLDLHLEQDPNSRVAIETCGGIGMVFITGEVTSNAVVTRETIVNVVHNITTDDTIELTSTHNRLRLQMELILVEQVTKEL
jgi:S-adenosylmethionine synthetase